jgi:hypothetical protein
MCWAGGLIHDMVCSNKNGRCIVTQIDVSIILLETCFDPDDSWEIYKCWQNSCKNYNASINLLVELKHNRSLKVVEQGMNFYGPSLIH